MLAAFVGGLLLYSAPLRAADPSPIACPNGQTVFLEGQAPPGEAVLAYLRGRPVGGGLADSSGRYRVPLRAQERPGTYPVEVRLRSSRAVVGTFTCFVDRPVGADLPPTATLAGTAPVTGTARTATVATPPTTVARTGVATPRTNVTGSPTRTGTTTTTGIARTTTGTARTTTGSATATATPGTTTPTATTTASVSSTVVIRDIFLRDPISPDDSAEFVEIENTTRNAVDISGWRLSNLSRTGTVPPFVFPSYTLEPDMIIVIYSEVGDNNINNGEFFWDQIDDIWKVGEVAELRDSRNVLIATLSVPAQ